MRAFVLTAFLLLSAGQVRAGTWSPEVLHQTRELRYSTVFPQGGSNWCRGVIVGPRVFLTARHCKSAFLDHRDSYGELVTRKITYHGPGERTNPGAEPTKIGKVLKIVEFSEAKMAEEQCSKEARPYLSRDPDFKPGLYGLNSLDTTQCLLARYHRDDIVAMVTTQPLFSADQILPVAIPSQNFPILANLLSWRRSDLIQPGRRDFLKNLEPGNSKRIVRRLTYHEAETRWGTAPFLRCDDQDPYDICMVYPGDSGGFVVQEIASVGPTVVGVISGNTNDPVLIQDADQAYQMKKNRSEKLMDRDYVGVYPSVVALGSVTDSVVTFIQRLNSQATGSQAK
jgi:hypothetical protein